MLSLSVLRVVAAHGPLAQLAEQLTLNQRVQGSSPWGLTTTIGGGRSRSVSHILCPASGIHAAGEMRSQRATLRHADAASATLGRHAYITFVPGCAAPLPQFLLSLAAVLPLAYHQCATAMPQSIATTSHAFTGVLYGNRTGSSEVHLEYITGSTWMPHRGHGGSTGICAYPPAVGYSNRRLSR